MTSATVGYGDIVPVTTAGRVVSVLTIVLGFFVFANSVALIAQSVHNFLERRSLGTVQVKVRDHIVICEYTAVADELIQSLPGCSNLAGTQVAIVTSLVSRNPYPQHCFVFGVPINPAALRLANIQEARYVFVFANLRFADPDVKTMHIAARVMKLNPHAKVFVELVNPKSGLLEDTPSAVVVLDSRELIRCILAGRPLDPTAWLPEELQDDGAAGSART